MYLYTWSKNPPAPNVSSYSAYTDNKKRMKIYESLILPRCCQSPWHFIAALKNRHSDSSSSNGKSYNPRTVEFAYLYLCASALRSSLVQYISFAFFLIIDHQISSWFKNKKYLTKEEREAWRDNSERADGKISNYLWILVRFIKDCTARDIAVPSCLGRSERGGAQPPTGKGRARNLITTFTHIGGGGQGGGWHAV